jgi:ribosomal protein S20
VQKKKLKNQLKLSKLRTKMKTKLAAQMNLDSEDENEP